MSSGLASFNWKEQYETDTAFQEIIDSFCQGVLDNLPAWKERLNRSVNPLKSLPILDAIPLLCKGTECQFASKCEVLKAMKDKPEEILKLIGTDCRVERVLVPKFFLEYLELLQIKPTDVGDMLEVANLVALIIHRRRLEMDLAIHGVNEQTAIGVQQGRAIFQRAPNPSYKILEGINKQIANIEGQLATSRKDRLSMENKNADQLMKWFDEVQKQLPKQNKALKAADVNNILDEN
jgi:hypothetical protein